MRRALTLPSVVCALHPTAALGHDFGSGKGAYEDFLSGNQAVFADLPIVLGLIATGILVGIWKSHRLPKVWLFFIGGIVVGAALGLWGILPPTPATYVAVCLVGLVGAASPDLPLVTMRIILGLMGMMLANAVLSGHAVGEVPPFAYLGIAFALNLGLAMSAVVVTSSLDRFQFGWVNVTWRALMSWLVAISIMAIVLTLKSTQ